MRFSFERTIRTPFSEQWVAFAPESEDERVGVFDLHMTRPDQVQGTLFLLTNLPQERLDQLLQQFDDDVVESADLHSGNFELAIFHGEERGVFQITPDPVEQ